GRRLLMLVVHETAAGAAQELLDEGGGVDAAAEVRVLQNRLLKGDGGLDAGDHVFAEGATHLVHRFAAVLAVGDELADHRVVGRRNGVAGIYMAVHADAAPAGGVIHLDAAGRRAEFIERVLGIDAAFDGVAFDL